MACLAGRARCASHAATPARFQVVNGDSSPLSRSQAGRSRRRLARWERAPPRPSGPPMRRSRSAQGGLGPAPEPGAKARCGPPPGLRAGQARPGLAADTSAFPSQSPRTISLQIRTFAWPEPPTIHPDPAGRLRLRPAGADRLAGRLGLGEALDAVSGCCSRNGRVGGLGAGSAMTPRWCERRGHDTRGKP